MYTQLNGFIVLQVLGHGSYQPIFSSDDGLMFFMDQKSAESEIVDTIVSIKEAVDSGNMDKDSQLGDEDYEIVPATVIDPWKDPLEQQIVCFCEGNFYTMLRKEDDWRIAHISLH